MSAKLRIIWLIFFVGAAVMAVYNWTRPPSDAPDGAGGGTGCACLGFGAFLVLGGLTVADQRVARRRANARKIDVITEKPPS